MSEMVVLQNDVSLEGVRRVHVMSDAEIGRPYPPALSPDGSREEHGTTNIPSGERELGIDIPAWAEVKEWEEIRIHHLTAEWKPRGELVRFERRFACGADCPVCRGKGCAWRRLVALWILERGERVSQAIGEAAVEYALRTGQDPAFAWVRFMPKGAEYGMEVPVGGEAMVNLYSADWMPEGAVAVGRGN